MSSIDFIRLIDHFSTTNIETSTTLASLRTLLLAYHTSLRATRLTHYSLTGFALPPTLDPTIPHPLPTRFRVLSALLFSTTASLLRLPFFLLPLLIHLPVYVISKSSLRFSKLEEDHAQNKIGLGLILAGTIYFWGFILSWWILFLVPFGSIIAIGIVWLVAIYHTSLVDENC